MGLRYVKGLGVAEQAALTAEPGPYASLEELVRRTRLGRPALHALAEAGALGGLRARSAGGDLGGARAGCP
jgi:DNA polymerase III alpha subunit